MLTFHPFISSLLLKRIVNQNHLLYCHFFCSPPSLLLKSTRPSLDLRSPLAVTCIPGMYQNEKSQVKCKLCALDHYSEVSKAIECKSCPLGWSSKEGKFFCVACSAGKKVRDKFIVVKLLLDFFYSRMFVFFLLILLLLSLLLFFSFSIRLLPSRVMNASLEDTRMPQNKTNASYVLLGISNICLINHFVYRVVLDYIKTKLKGKILLLFDIKLKHL